MNPGKPDLPIPVAPLAGRRCRQADEGRSATSSRTRSRDGKPPRSGSPAGRNRPAAARCH
ncbi:hypothetical protein EXZ48_15540 [Shinella sp. JR1-6]|nr:hypothetical protein EXZ48_15540 [Shinella sp. JR1-6]